MTMAEPPSLVATKPWRRRSLIKATEVVSAGTRLPGGGTSDVQVEVTQITCLVLSQRRGVDLVPTRQNIQNFIIIDIYDIKLGAGPSIIRCMHVK